jgi:hypothetical protein
VEIFALLSSSGGVVAYYEIAATLIPLLVFGGVVTERLIPSASQWQPRHDRATWGLLCAGLLAVTAELMAISVVATGIANLIERYVVSAALVGGMLGAVWAFWLPWLSRKSEAGKGFSPGQAAWVLLVVGVAAVYALAASVNLATTEELEKEARAQVEMTLKETQEARHRLERADARKADVIQQVAEAREGHERRVVQLLIAKRAKIDRHIRELRTQLHKLENRTPFGSAASVIARTVLEQLVRHRERAGGR